MYVSSTRFTNSKHHPLTLSPCTASGSSFYPLPPPSSSLPFSLARSNGNTPCSSISIFGIDTSHKKKKIGPGK